MRGALRAQIDYEVVIYLDGLGCVACFMCGGAVVSLRILVEKAPVVGV
jgi:hypothetical protein